MTKTTQAAAWPRRPMLADTERPTTYVFYDLETTGLDRDFDQITQIAMVKTDADFNVVDEVADIRNFRCRRLPWVVPSPAALLTTRTDPHELEREELLPQEAMQQVMQALDDFGPAVCIGFNNIRFDDEQLRRGFFSALQSPYLLPGAGSLRIDLMVMAQAVHVLKPDAIVVPPLEDTGGPVGDGSTRGKRSFRLHALVRANGLPVDDASTHDALGDVRVSIALARLMKQRAPEVFELVLANASKWHVIEVLKRSSRPDARSGSFEPLVQITVIGGEAKVVPVVGLFPSATQPGRIVTAALSIDPLTFLGLSDDALAAFVAEDRWRFPAIKANALPIILPMTGNGEAIDAVIADHLDRKLAYDAEFVEGGVRQLILDRMRMVMDAGEPFQIRLAAALASAQPSYPEPQHVEQKLYSCGFVSRMDAALARRMADMDPEPMAEHAFALQDPRLREHAMRWAFTADPDAIPVSDRQRLYTLIRERLLAPADRPWRSIAKAREELLAVRLSGRFPADRDTEDRINRIAHWLHEAEQGLLRGPWLDPLGSASVDICWPEGF
jgi:exodeoxyribonuclease I